MRIRWILRLATFLGLSAGILAFARATDDSQLLKTADEMVKTAARLRGLEPKSPILKGVKTRPEIAKYLNEKVQEEYKDGELQYAGETLKKLGLIPPSMDYRDFLIKLLTEQVGGFYDTDTRTYYIASWLPVEEQKPVMIHELTHALQDQYFNIKKIFDEDRKTHNDDRTLAHQALVEGDAVLVMMQSIIEPFKRHFSQLPDLGFVTRTLAMESQSAVYNSAPVYIQETLLFPYAYGSSFLQQIWKQSPSWDSINKIYSDLPASSEQIMHPAKYYGIRDNPIPVGAAVYTAKLGKDWKVVYKNVLGEFSLGLLLSLELTEENARRAATGWGGDQVLLLQNKQGKNAVLVSTIWDTSDDADKFYAAMDEWFRKRFPEAPRSEETAAGFSIVRDGEFHSLQHEATGVRFVIGMPKADSGQLTGF
jgi:hypothetical protein